MRYCPKCKSLNLDMTEVCMRCNEPLEKVSKNEETGLLTQAKKKMIGPVTQVKTAGSKEMDVDRMEHLLDDALKLLQDDEDEDPLSELSRSGEEKSSPEEIISSPKEELSTPKEEIPSPEEELSSSNEELSSPREELSSSKEERSSQEEAISLPDDPKPENPPVEEPPVDVAPDELDEYSKLTKSEIKIMKNDGRLIEIIEEGIEEFKNEGWIVESLEETLEEDLDFAWELFLLYKKNLKKIPSLKYRMDRLYAKGYMADIRSIQSVIKDLDLTDDVEGYIKNLEMNVSQGTVLPDRLGTTGLRNTLPANGVEHELEYGKDAYLRGAYKQAIVSFRSVLKARPNDTNTASLLKRAIILNRCKHAKIVGTQRFGEEPEGDLVSHYQSRGILGEQGGMETATLILNKSPEEIEAIGYNQYINQNYEAAAELFTTALEIKPDLKRAAFRLKVCKKKLNEAS